jgi:hypothetical protein
MGGQTRPRTPAREDKARQLVPGLGRNGLDYVTRRFNESSAGLKKLVALDLRWKAA